MGLRYFYNLEMKIMIKIILYLIQFMFFISFQIMPQTTFRDNLNDECKVKVPSKNTLIIKKKNVSKELKMDVKR